MNPASFFLRTRRNEIPTSSSKVPHVAANLAQQLPDREQPDVTGVSEIGHCTGAQAQTVSTVTEQELEQHIDDSHWLYRTAYERFQTYRNPHDRDEALLHLHRMNQALLARSAAVQAARHAAFEQRISEGCDFFQSPYALALGQQYRRSA